MGLFTKNVSGVALAGVMASLKVADTFVDSGASKLFASGSTLLTVAKSILFSSASLIRRRHTKRRLADLTCEGAIRRSSRDFFQLAIVDSS
jgi:hypothetical protein